MRWRDHEAVPRRFLPALGARSVTATYSDESLHTILESLALTLHMKIIQDGEGIALMGIEQ